MNETTKTLEIKLLDRELRVTCPEEERLALLDSAAYLDKVLREIRDSGRIYNSERIILMAALNITHEMLAAKAANGVDINEYKRRIENMESRVDAELTHFQDDKK